MSTIPIKIDGIGTRKSGTTDLSSTAAELANTATSNYTKVRRLIAGEALAIGDVVALDLNVTESNLEGGHGYGAVVKKAASGTAAVSFAIGVAMETIAQGDPGRIQVAGKCTFAKSDIGDTVVGAVLGADATAGVFGALPTGHTACAISIVEGTTDTGGDSGSTVFLLNPANL